MRGKALAPEVGLTQLAALHHGSHRAVEDENALGEETIESFEDVHQLFFLSF
jgi:hypothetical protein